MGIQQNVKHSSVLYIPMLITLLLVAGTIVYLSHSSDIGKNIITLYGPWKFKVGDDMQYAHSGFNDAGWETADLTPPPGAHDDDVGLSGYVPGWTAKGHPGYSGYAWYHQPARSVLYASERKAGNSTGVPSAGKAQIYQMVSALQE